MSQFFSLDGSKDQNHQTDPNNNNNSLFLFKNDEIYNKGFELWQQYYQLHQQQKHPNNNNINIQDVGFSIGPGRRNDNNNNNNNICEESSSYGHRSRGGSEGMNCQDCGNKAKKECGYMRCRACCKSRGFQCQTHVKSTWVPAAKRRERMEKLTALEKEERQVVIRGDNSKRLRESIGGSGGGSRLPGLSTGFELGSHFPAEVNCPAVFRCVRVSSAKDDHDHSEEHLAYQTAVSIGGHVFKGILYDQGDHKINSGGGHGERLMQHQPLDLIAATTSNAYNTTLDPSMYMTSTPLTSFMAGTQFFLPPRT